MRSSSRLIGALGMIMLLTLVLVAFRNLPTRGFAADDFQWLIAARTQSFGRMLRDAFAPDQNHFYRPLIWVSFWLQQHLFGLDPRGFHAVSLGLHVANTLLTGWLVWKLADAQPSALRRALAALLAAAIVALHPAPFEAVTWVSAQSDLLAGFWLLLMLHLWLAAASVNRRPAIAIVLRLLSTCALALALLTKESAVIGLPLLILLDLWVVHVRLCSVQHAARITVYSLPALFTMAYLVIQLRVERENYLVNQRGYGFGPQLLLNPLRSLALLIAPLPGTESAAAPWLVPFGALVAALLVGLLLRRRRVPLLTRLLPLAALALALLPTAPFVSPPDSRYLYLPVITFACIFALHIAVDGRWPLVDGRWLSVALIVAFAIYATAETSAREARFATSSGAGNSLWRLATAICAERRPDRIIVLNTPTAEIHARAALQLACGKQVTPIFVDTLAIAQANLEPNSVIIDFPGGSARIVRRT